MQGRLKSMKMRSLSEPETSIPANGMTIWNIILTLNNITLYIKPETDSVSGLINKVFTIELLTKMEIGYILLTVISTLMN